MSKCQFPGCIKQLPEGRKYCLPHGKYFGEKEEKKLKTYTIPNKSDKKKEIDKELSKMYHVFLAEPGNDVCQLKLKGCLKKATVVHHLRGRIGDQVFEIKDWRASCVWCNISLENDPEAYKKGLKKSKFHD